MNIERHNHTEGLSKNVCKIERSDDVVSKII